MCLLLLFDEPEQYDDTIVKNEQKSIKRIFLARYEFNNFVFALIESPTLANQNACLRY